MNLYDEQDGTCDMVMRMGVVREEVLYIRYHLYSRTGSLRVRGRVSSPK